MKESDTYETPELHFYHEKRLVGTVYGPIPNKGDTIRIGLTGWYTVVRRHFTYNGPDRNDGRLSWVDIDVTI